MKPILAQVLGGVLLGVTLGFLAASFTGVGEDAAEALYDHFVPVVESRAQVVERSPARWVVVMNTHKQRDCRLLESQAFDVSPSRAVRRLEFTREDGKPSRAMPVGNFTSSRYVIEPAPAHKLALSYLHECQGRAVRSEIKIMGAPQ